MSCLNIWFGLSSYVPSYEIRCSGRSVRIVNEYAILSIVHSFSFNHIWKHWQLSWNKHCTHYRSLPENGLVIQAETCQRTNEQVQEVGTGSLWVSCSCMENIQF